MKILPVNKGQGYLFEDALNRKYLTDTDIAEGVLIYSENPTYFTDARYFSAAKEILRQAGVNAVLYRGTEDLTAEIKKRGIKTLYVDYSATTMEEYARYKKLCRRVKDCSALIRSLRLIKDKGETDCIIKACGIVQRAVREAFSFARENITEIEIKKFLEDRMLSLGANEVAFDTIVAFGKNAAVPHHVTGGTKLALGDAILIDAGCKVNGYCSDITRTAFFGIPDKEFVAAYDAVLAANVKAEKEIYAGITGREADKIARDELDKNGLGEYFTHSLGHGVGLKIHESPRLSPRSDDVLTENQIFTVEPGVYKDGKFGIRIEDTCVMRGGKAVRLFDDDKNLLTIKG